MRAAACQLRYDPGWLSRGDKLRRASPRQPQHFGRNCSRCQWWHGGLLWRDRLGLPYQRNELGRVLGRELLGLLQIRLRGHDRGKHANEQLSQRTNGIVIAV